MHRLKHFNFPLLAVTKLVFVLVFVSVGPTVTAQNSESKTNAGNGKSEPESTWSKPVNGLQARLVLVQKGKLHGVHWLVPYLELQNVRDLGNAMEVDCGSKQFKVELVDKDRKPIRSGWTLPRSGPVPDLSVVVLPFDSFMRISLECRNWGIGKDDAMIQTDSGAWTLTNEENGKVFLTATLVGEETKPNWKHWHGKLELPLVPVEWDNSKSKDITPGKKEKP